uniref:Zinc ribbon domain-containing protein n=1 Tax=Thermomicrobium roseum TaxID=500 RepID=A0A7C5RSG4_THERO
MPQYVFRCAGGHRYLVRMSMSEVTAERLCPCGKRAVRVFTSPVIVMRPPNYSASPNDPAYWEGIHEDPQYLPCQIAPARDGEAVTEGELRDLCALAREAT